MATRYNINDFALGNPAYVGATVSFWTVSGGAKTTTLATLYAASTGSTTLSNPRTLDSDGKFSVPVYAEVPVIATVSGLTVADHDTGIMGLAETAASTSAAAAAASAAAALVSQSAAGVSAAAALVSENNAAATLAAALPKAGGNMTGGINSARGNITQHATTMDFFAVTSPDILDGTGSAVTITACVDAPQAGATRKFYPIVATVLTHGATFDIAGNANLTAAAGDCWIIEAKTESTYRVTAVKEDGTAVVAASSGAQIQPISASVAGNALTISAPSLNLDFRSATLTSGTVTRVTGDPADLVISSGSTLGTVANVASRLAVIAMNNAGTIELAVRNVTAGANLDETGLISTTAEGGAGAADSATVNYSTTARSNLAYRVIGYVESTQATPGTWVTAPSTIQGEGGNAHAVKSAWVIHTPVAAANQTAIDFTGIPAWATEVVVSILGGSLNASDAFLIQLGDAGGFETTGYSGTYIQIDSTGAQLSSGFRDIANAAADTKTGVYRLLLIDRATNTWHCVGSMSRIGTGDCSSIFGSKALTDTLTQVRLTQVAGTSQIDAGSFNYQYR
ncbi:MAG: hypothetical protein KBE22_16230 [Candidatus Accumulibacter sp.]|nr:hypothetical protein [Accumulibacter sp.]